MPPSWRCRARTYPVEIRYRPLEVTVRADDDTEDPDDPDHEIVRTEIRDPTEAIVDAVRELESEPPGDVLVFLSGEREIRDTAEALKDLPEHRGTCRCMPACPPRSSRRCSNPATADGGSCWPPTSAETSLTVPGIRYVVDPGTARISRYSRRTKVQRLPIEPISQASAAQRAGRSGRTAPGVCIRLYSEEDFESRPRYTDPEILRTNLAAVILQMAALQLGDIADFPFLDPPDARSIRDGVQLLQELGAFDSAGARHRCRTTTGPVATRPARRPDDPAGRHRGLVYVRCWCWPPRCRSPIRANARVTGEEAARQKHARFADEHSDFISYLNLLAVTCGSNETSFRAMPSDGCAARSSCTTCGSGNGRT